MDWKSILQNAIEQYTTVNGFAPKSALVSEDVFESIFDKEERGHETWLDGVRVLYSLRGDNNTMYLFKTIDGARKGGCRDLDFTPIQTSVSDQEQAPDELPF